jgi:hypothetical protein
VSAPEDRPGARLAEVLLPEGALERDLAGMMLPRIHFHGGTHVHTAPDLDALASHHDAVYVAGTPWAALKSEIMAGHPGWVLTPEFKEGVATVVEAVAEGRRAAAAIEKALKP